MLETMQFHPRVVIDVQVALLGHSKHHFIVEKPKRRGKVEGEKEKEKEE